MCKILFKRTLIILNLLLDYDLVIGHKIKKYCLNIKLLFKLSFP